MAGLGTWLAPHTRSRRMGMPLPFVVNATFTPRVLTRAPFSPRPARAKGDLETNRFDPEGAFTVSPSQMGKRTRDGREY